jgi:hypothetical protein
MVTLEIKRARFVVGQRCLLRLRVSGPDRDRFVVRLGIEHQKLESGEAAAQSARPGEPALVTFAFTPAVAGEFRVRYLTVRAGGTWSLADGDIALRISATENESSGVVYNIQVGEMYGSDFKIDQRAAPVAPIEPEWRAVALEPGAAPPIARLLADPSAVPSALFREAYEDWNSPRGDVVTIGDSHWTILEPLGRGDLSDLFLAERARWPTERVALKILRDPSHAARLRREAEILRRLQASDASGADTFTRLVPEPVAAGDRAMAVRWAGGFRHNLAQVRKLYPRGVEPRVSVWMWRRILELLTFLHRSGVVHGAVAPEHVLIENGEHGVRLVGYGAARQAPPPGDDISMSARTIRYALGDAPGPMEELLREGDSARDAWELRERVGERARSLFGPPAFCPLSI